MLKPEVFSYMMINQHLSHLAIAAGILVLVAMAWLPHAVSAAAALSGLYEQPLLVVDPGMHTARINRADVDEAGTSAVTGSHDKTVRVWSLHPPHLLTTLRMPAGPGNLGKIYAVAMSPDGAHIAVGGWTRWTEQDRSSRFPCSPATGRWSRGLKGCRTLCCISPSRAMAAIWQPGLLEPTASASMTARQTGAKSPGMLSMALVFTAWRSPQTAVWRPRALMARSASMTGSGGGVHNTRRHRARSPSVLRSIPWMARSRSGSIMQTPVALLDGATLAPRPSPEVGGIDNGDVATVAWSRDGTTLYAGGKYADKTGAHPVVAWADRGQGARRLLTSGATNTLMSLLPLPGGALLVAAQDPHVALLQAEGTVGWAAPSPLFNGRGQQRTLAVSADGMLVDFGYESGGKAPARFDLRQRQLLSARPADGLTAPPRQAGLALDGWEDTSSRHSTAPRCHSISMSSPAAWRCIPTRRGFVLGTEWSLRAYAATGTQRWRREVPGVVRAVNITGDGRLVVAAYGDGTIRWHRLEDGVELLAFMPRSTSTTGSPGPRKASMMQRLGPMASCSGTQSRLGGGRGDSCLAIPKLNRPTVLPLMIQEMDPVRALGIAEQADIRAAVKSRTGARVAPGALLHIVSIGVSDYGEHATKLKLAYAQKDAHDVAHALMRTQTSLYADIKLQYLPNGEAKNRHHATHWDDTYETLAASPQGRDLAVVMFSGHGAIIDDRYYLLPHDTDARTPPDQPRPCPVEELVPNYSTGGAGAGARAAGRLPCGGGEWRWQSPGCERQGLRAALAATNSPCSPRRTARRSRAKTPPGRTGPSPWPC